ncbi:DctM TRAP-type C4-dicarboxylate transport system, small permease component [Rhabdaerophilaceae bacterium]
MHAPEQRASSGPTGVLRRALDGLYLGAGYFAGLFLIVILALMMALSLGRPLGINIPAGDEFAAWSMAAMAFLGLAHTFRSGDMIRVGLLVDKLSGRKKWFMEVLCLLIGTVIVGFFAWHATVFTKFSWILNDRAQGVVPVPLWIPQLAYCGGLILLTIAMIDELIHVLRGGTPHYEKPKPKTAEEVIEQALQSAV